MQASPSISMGMFHRSVGQGTGSASVSLSGRPSPSRSSGSIPRSAGTVPPANAGEEDAAAAPATSGGDAKASNATRGDAIARTIVDRSFLFPASEEAAGLARRPAGGWRRASFSS